MKNIKVLGLLVLFAFVVTIPSVRGAALDENFSHKISILRHISPKSPVLGDPEKALLKNLKKSISVKTKNRVITALKASSNKTETLSIFDKADKLFSPQGPPQVQKAFDCLVGECYSLSDETREKFLALFTPFQNDAHAKQGLNNAISNYIEMCLQVMWQQGKNRDISREYEHQIKEAYTFLQSHPNPSVEEIAFYFR